MQEPDLGTDSAPVLGYRDVDSILRSNDQKRAHQNLLFFGAGIATAVYLIALLVAIFWALLHPCWFRIMVASGPPSIALVIFALVVLASVPLSLGMMLSKLVADKPSKDDSPVQIALPQTEIVKALLQVITRDK